MNPLVQRRHAVRRRAPGQHACGKRRARGDGSDADPDRPGRWHRSSRPAASHAAQCQAAQVVASRACWNPQRTNQSPASGCRLRQFADGGRSRSHRGRRVRRSAAHRQLLGSASVGCATATGFAPASARQRGFPATCCRAAASSWHASRFDAGCARALGSVFGALNRFCRCAGCYEARPDPALDPALLLEARPDPVLLLRKRKVTRLSQAGESYCSGINIVAREHRAQSALLHAGCRAQPTQYSYPKCDINHQPHG